ncbi:MAG TPA: MBOAT family O-acyltransferase [Phycisphaerae bacterium]|nr:MBOAT family O-acyltransferase [Phycisphaerae bacterium]HRR85131.1 MBOAT family O-acyltransferase [Phycisphaerae bacterium]
MLFNSFIFVGFLSVVLPLYYVLSHKWQNRMLLAASYVFYGAWDWRFCFLLAGTTLVDFQVARAIDRTADERRRKLLLLLSLSFGLGVLGFFKYCGFFVDSLNDLLACFGLGRMHWAVKVILPVGISFYTFQSLSYTIDVYRRRLKPVDGLVDYGLYVAYFPQLVAGPIERAINLLPRIMTKRTVGPAQIATAAQLVLMGYLKKIAIADAVAPCVEQIFSRPTACSSLKLLLGVYLFAVQIYCDFSGYSDIARGVSRWFGIELMVNFRQPYLSADIVDFWRRWHISLSTWLRDYLYIPLGGNRCGRLKTYRNLMITMLLGGLWHGAAWTFVIWGGLHGLYLSAAKLIGIRPMEQQIRTPRQLAAFGLRVLATFHLVCLGWVFFRAGSLDVAWSYLTGLAQLTTAVELRLVCVTGFYLTLMLLIDLPCWVRNEEYPLTTRTRWYVRGLAQATAVILISFVGAGHGTAFIYFRF